MKREIRISSAANSIQSGIHRCFSSVVTRQGHLVDQQEKKAKALEARAKKVVERAQRARSQANVAERSAVRFLKDSGLR